VPIPRTSCTAKTGPMESKMYGKQRLCTMLSCDYSGTSEDLLDGLFLDRRHSLDMYMDFHILTSRPYLRASPKSVLSRVTTGMRYAPAHLLAHRASLEHNALPPHPCDKSPQTNQRESDENPLSMYMARLSGLQHHRILWCM
jgi:hypothetical protein